MNDLISRQEAINAILHYTIRIPGYMSEWGRKLTAAIKEDLMDEINAIPPTQQWIPVSESPKKDDRYQVTRLDYVTDTKFIDILWYEKNIWWNRQATGDYAVTAWMPLPEPYAPTQSNDSKALDALEGKGEKNE